MKHVEDEIKIDRELLNITKTIVHSLKLALHVLIRNVFYEDWGYTDICHRIKMISTHLKPMLKVLLPNSYDCVQIFELFFMKEYPIDVIFKNINENIMIARVTHRELLKIIALYFLMATVICPPRDLFF